MKAISLWPPYSTLVSIGEKKWETRGRATKHRGTIAIHSTAKFDRDLFHIAGQEPFLSALQKHGIHVPGAIECGAIVALVDITEVIPTAEWIRRYCRVKNLSDNLAEYYFGDYSPGRYAWKLENLRRVHPAVPLRGRQWIFGVPDDLVPVIEKRATPYQK